MSVHFCVFLRESDLPTQELWQQAVQNAGYELVFDDFSPDQHTGFLPTQLAGEQCGFEYCFDPVGSGEFKDMRSVIGNRTHVVTFTWHSSMLDMHAAEIAASALTDISDGVFLDPQSGAYAQGKDVYAHFTNEHNRERERKLAEAEHKWGKVTERRCSECGARCPEYRGSCFVCGFAIGKLPA